MSDPIIKQQLLDYLYRGPVTVPCDGALRDTLGWTEYSKNAVCEAMGSLIKEHKVERIRTEPQHLHDDDRPVTYCTVENL